MPKVACLSPLYFADESYIGGGERYPTNLARGVVLASGGRYQVELVSFGKAAATREIAPGVLLRVLRAAREPLNPLDVLSWDLPEALADADVVHIHQAYTRCSEVGLLVARQLGKPTCVTDHGGYSSQLGMHYGALDLADLVVAYSDFGGSLHACKTPIAVVKGGVDSAEFTPSDPPESREFVLYVGRLLPHKAVDRLVEALPARLPLVACVQPYHSDYQRRVSELARGKDVRFVTDATTPAALAPYYRRAWACVLPSQYRDCYGATYPAPELMGLTLLEAMACGTPAVASRVGGMPEFIRDGETGFVFDEFAELTARLEQLADDPTLVERLGRNARQAVVDEFDIRVAGRRLVETYDRLIGRARGVAA